jgi:uncharacterized membrane-anchored protein
MAESRGAFAGRWRPITIGTMTLAVVNLQVAGKERLVQNGTTVLLQLAPADPRSLMQGDYMALRYRMADSVAGATRAAGIRDGSIVIELDENQEAEFIEIHDDQPLGANRHLLQFRKRGGTVRLASDAYFFEEGEGSTFRTASFGELKVSADGDAVLIGLRDAHHRRLGTPELDPRITR